MSHEESLKGWLLRQKKRVMPNVPFHVHKDFRVIKEMPLSKHLQRYLGPACHTTQSSKFYWATLGALDSDEWAGGWCNELRTAFWCSSIGSQKLIVPDNQRKSMYLIELQTDNPKQEERN